MIPFRILNNKIIDLEHIKEDDIDITHIAHALSMQCRYNGQIPSFYSVAQHSTFVSNILYNMTNDKQIALCGLLHDAAEAYIGDIVAPFKNRLPFTKELEGKIIGRILDKYNIKHTYMLNKELIDRIDHRLYELEVRYFFDGAKSICGDLPQCNINMIKGLFMVYFNYWYTDDNI